MIMGCFAGFVIDADKLLLIGSSISFAIITLLVLKKFRLSTRFKVGLIYGHLISLFFPFVLLTTDVACNAGCMPCANNIANLLALTFPTTLLLSTVAAFFVIPGFYMFFSRKSETGNIQITEFVKFYSRRLKIKMPKIYIIDNANPIAFSFKSFRPMIFLSAGLIDLLNKREIEAVILHELGHLKRKASVLTTSLSLFRIFSPFSLLARFHHDSDEEELYADEFAAALQKTGRHLKSAKRKIDEFERSKSVILDMT